MYFTSWNIKHASAYFLNTCESVFLFRTTKADQGPTLAAQWRHLGPEMTHVFDWDQNQGTWVLRAIPVDDGSSNLFDQFAGLPALLAQYHTNQIDFERLISISCGQARAEDWMSPRVLPSFCIDDSEVIYRLTFAQDEEPRCVEWRRNLLSKFSALTGILRNLQDVPIQIRDIHGNGVLSFDPHFPHQNFADANFRATVIYAGENRTETELREIRKSIEENLHRSHADKKRLLVWHRVDNELKIYEGERRQRIDQMPGAPIEITEPN